MSDPVFTFPGGETVQPPEDDIFSADVFAGLGSMDVDENPFAGMEPMAVRRESCRVHHTCGIRFHK